MKLFINRKPIYSPWGGGNNFVRALFEFAPKFGVDIGVDLNKKYDAILIMDPRPDEHSQIGINEIKQYKRYYQDVKIIQRINECDARKQTNDIDLMLHSSGMINDHTIFVSHWMRDYFLKKSWPCENNSVVINGVNKQCFKPGSKIHNGKINMMTSHWSDNPLKGQDVYEWIDRFVGLNQDQYTFTYIGRTKANLKNSTIISPLFDLALGDEINKYDVCINGSTADPAPNSVIEAIASNIPTYAHARGGGIIELIGNDHVFHNENELESILLKKKFYHNTWVPDDWETCICLYLDKIFETVNK